MKKILLALFLLVLTVPVHGLENENIQYKYYRLNKVLGPIVYKDEVSEEFPLIDEDNPIKTELSELSTEKPEEKVGREIYEYEGYHYLKVPKIDSLEIKMRDDSSLFNINITNIHGDINVTSDNDGNLLNGEIGNFWFDEPVSLEDLLISAITKDGNEFSNFIIYFKSNNIKVSFLDVCAMTNSNHYIYGNQAMLDEGTFESVYSIDEKNDDDLIYKGKIKLYQFADYQYQSYKLEREYYPEYLSSPFEDYIYRDDQDYIIVNKVDNNFKNDLIPLGNMNNEVLDYNNDVEELVTNDEKITQDLTDSVDSGKSIDVDSKKPTQYQNVLKMDNGKTVSNTVDNSKLYTYFILVILVILLLLMLKIRNRLKTSYRW